MTTDISTSFVTNTYNNTYYSTTITALGTSTYNNTYYSTAYTTLGTSSFTTLTSSSSITSTTTPVYVFYIPPCDNASEVRLNNGTCIPRTTARVGYEILIFFILLLFFLYTYSDRIS